MAIRPNRINVDLGPYKQAWVAYCTARGETPSALFRQMAAQLLADAAGHVVTTPVGPGKLRKEIRLTEEEVQHVATAARHAGMSEVRWMTALIRAHMTGHVQLGPIEAEALGRSNLALLAIGRNMNQLVRAANAHATLLPADMLAVLVALRVQLIGHVDEVARILSANQKRWRTI